MNVSFALPTRNAGSLRSIGAAAIVLMFVFTSLACNDTQERAIDLEVTVKAMDESFDVVADENAELKLEVKTPSEGLDETESRSTELEKTSSKVDVVVPDKVQRTNEVKEEWSNGKENGSPTQNDPTVEATVRMAEDAGGLVHYVEHAGRGDRTVLVTPQEFVDGQTPLIVSLHGFGGNSFYQSSYFPLHEHVNIRGFGLLLPNGIRDGDGNRFWNPTDHCCEGGKSGEDDVAYLTELVAKARKINDFGHVYFFGYSNGGFMSHHLACKGLPGLRAVASLAGTSYVEDSSCEGALPVSVLQIHGTEDSVIMYEGAESELGSDGERAFSASAEDMVARWSEIAGCDWPEDAMSYATFDFDEWVPGSETRAFRVEPSCADGISIELWKGVGSGHSPAMGEAFVDALLTWLLAQK